MQPKPHLAACSAFWADLGVSVEDQHAAASWAFCVPAVASEAGCMELPEDRQWTFNAISTPASLDKPKHYTPPPAEFVAALAALAEYGLFR